MAQRVLPSTVRQYETLQRLTALGLAQAYRTWTTKNWPVLTALLTAIQLEAARAGIDSVEEMAAEQGIATAAAATPVATALAGYSSGGVVLSSLVEAAESIEGLIQLVRTEIADAGRVAQGLAITATPQLEGYVRYLNPPSCSRCTVLAGRVYPYSIGFERHPQCDCVMIPVSDDPDSNLVADPMEAFEQGLITDLTAAEVAAIKEGADIAQVVNVRRKGAGLSVAGRVLERGGRLTPEAIYSLAGTRDEHIRLLIQNGYLVA